MGISSILTCSDIPNLLREVVEAVIIGKKEYI
jgi:hypothetical protein